MARRHTDLLPVSGETIAIDAQRPWNGGLSCQFEEIGRLGMADLILSVSGAADMELVLVGPRAGADVGDPKVSLHTMFNEDSIHVGVWECTPGGWAIENRSDSETASIVSGRGVITDANGSTHALVPGAIVTLPVGWSGRWDITETLRKVFVIVSR